MPSEFELDSVLASSSSQSFKTINLKNRSAGAKEELTFRYIVKGSDDSVKYGKRSPFIVLNNKLDTSAPNPITNLTVKPGLGDFVFSWTASTSKDVKEYEITISDATGTKTETKVFKTNSTSYTITASEIYTIFNARITTLRFSVKVVDNSGNKSSAVYIDVTIAIDNDGFGDLVTPSGPTLTAGIESITVTWDGKTSGNQLYSANLDKIEVIVNNNSYGFLLGAGKLTVSNLVGGSVATVVFKAYDKFGRVSGLSTAQQITVLSVPASVPETPLTPAIGGFTASGILGAIKLNWNGTYNSGSGFNGFNAVKIYASSSENGTYEFVGQMTSGNTPNSITIPINGSSVNYGVTTYFKASSTNTATPPEESALIGPLTVGNSATKLTATPLQATQLDLGPGSVSIAKLQGGVLAYNNILSGSMQSSNMLRVGSYGAARIEIAPNAFSYDDPLTPGNDAQPILAGITVYGSGSSGTVQAFRADMAGNVNINFAAGSSSSFSAGSGAAWTSGALSGVERFKIDSSGMYLGADTYAAATFKVNYKGQLEATQATIKGNVEASTGKIGDWTILSGRIQNAAGTVYLDATNGRIYGAQLQAASILGSNISMDTNSVKITFDAADYLISGDDYSTTEEINTPSYDSITGEFLGYTTTYQTVQRNAVKITDTTWLGATPSTKFYYGEMWLNSGNTYGEVTIYQNYQNGYMGLKFTASDYGQDIYLYGPDTANWTNEHLTIGSKDQPAVLQVDSSGRVSRGRAFFYTGSSSATILGSTWNSVGQNGDIVFSTNN